MEKGNKVPNLVMTYMPIGPRLQRLFYSKKTSQHLTWHSDHPIDHEKMIHPSEGRAWSHFDEVFPDFAQETRNIRLGLCTDGFSPNNSNGSSYSCWPVFITVYNLPPWLALKHQYILLPLIIPGPKNPRQNLDVFLQPLVHELKMLFIDGIETYDAHRRENFQMRAVLMWTVSDFPAYAMLSGWSTHGKLACPYCLDQSESLWLQKGNKHCWFDCHRKYLRKGHTFKKDKINFKKNKTSKSEVDIPYPTRDEIWQTVKHFNIVYEGTPYGPNYKKSDGFGVTHNWVKRSIFWELPYWCHLLIRHNLDLTHIEKNVFENMFHTSMDTPKSKDKLSARQDLEMLCDRPLLNPVQDKKGKAWIKKGDYTLERVDVKKFCAWLKKLKFLDGYASNIGNCVNVTRDSTNGSAKHLEPLANGPSNDARSYNGYFVNGYKFHTQEYGKGRVTNNYGLCVRGEIYNGEESDYYGLLDEILEIDYYGIGRSTVVLFKCTWFDNIRGVVVNKNKLVDVKPTSHLWAVVKTKPRGVYEVTEAETEVALDGSTEANGVFHLEERFQLPNEVNVSERLSLASNRTNFEQISPDKSEGSEAENQEDDSDEDDRDEPVYFDYYDPDEDKF
uniref:DUF4216 domain-containing protein n=1 Tax=Lactuca sativa TaxID=4236 RepID=A0A9R1V7Z2_LACSA|nr:hypothetical protein LSAT_V11C600317920 [Lactuca sativa]